MSLQDWEANGWLRKHATTPQEIDDLLAIAERDLRDASQEGISTDWRFGIAYNAALKLCTILLVAEGYRPGHGMAHYRTLAALPIILGEERSADAEYLEVCRRKRNLVEYDRIGGATANDADELIAFSEELREAVVAWLGRTHPELLPP